MSASGLGYGRYRIGGSDEWLMRIGDPAAPAVLFLPPLFEELNRTRALMASVMRLLAGEGLCCWLPDLPGTGESERALEEVSWEAWREAARASVDQPRATVALRGGALLDDAVDTTCRWRLAPVSGNAVARDLARAGLMAEGGGGYAPSEAMITALSAADLGTAARVRTVRLATDRAEADRKVEGPPLWRRSEPQNSSELAASVASDILNWMRQCGAC
ncbi:MAG TPA: hypothetical protein VHM92_07965 [Allosphingosinicella sp.]|nr:hypothetical protein [Allosphingosinicella sp.]